MLREKDPDWLGLYAELNGYLQEAVKDQAPVDAGELLLYLGELRNRYVRMTAEAFNAHVQHHIYHPELKAKLRQEIQDWYHAQGEN